MKILLIGNGNHQFITNYASCLKKQCKEKFQVDIFSLKHLTKTNERYYNQVFQLDDTSFSKIIGKIKGFRRYYRLYLFRKLVAELPKYDFIHFHFVGTDSYFLVDQLKNRSKSKIILSIWGSDLYRISSIKEKKFFKTCQKADIITFSNQESIKYFQSRYNWGKNNLRLCRFGLAPLENLKNIALTKEECKKQLNWNEKKLALTIGYNMSLGQQHIEILNQFESNKIKTLKNDIQVILPITYGGSSKYKKELLEKLKKLSFEYIIYENFLTDQQIALIRKASDIMIQLQKTDQFSGSMQEYLFAQNIVITGSWLPYRILKEYGVWFIEVNEINELSSVIPDTINKYSEYEEKIVNNTYAITELSSWEVNIQCWIDLYKH